MKMIASLLFQTRLQLFDEAKPREIVAVEGDNKLAFVQIVSKKVFYYTEDKHFLECKKKNGVIRLQI